MRRGVRGGRLVRPTALGSRRNAGDARQSDGVCRGREAHAGEGADQRDGGPPARRRVPRLRAQPAGRPGHVCHLRPGAERRHRRRPRHGRRAADWRRDRTAQGEDGALRADAVERRRAAFQHRGRPADSAGPGKGGRAGVLLRRRRPADCRAGSVDRRHRRRRRQHGRAVRLSGAHQGARTAAAVARAAGAGGGAAPRVAAGAAGDSSNAGRWAGRAGGDWQGRCMGWWAQDGAQRTGPRTSLHRCQPCHQPTCPTRPARPTSPTCPPAPI